MKNRGILLMDLKREKIRETLHSFRVKLIFGFLLCSLIPLLFIGIISYQISYGIAESKIVETTILADKQLQQNINNRFTQLEKVADSVYSNLYVLNSKMEKPTTEYMDSFGTTRNNMTFLLNTFQLFQICAFVHSDSMISKEGLMFYGLDQMKRYGLSEEDLSNIGINSKWIFKEGLNFPIIAAPKDRQVDSILCCRSLKEKGSLKFAYFVCIKSKELSSLLSAPFQCTPIESYIVDRDGTIVAHNLDKLERTHLDEETWKIITTQNRKEFVSLKERRLCLSVLNNGYYLMTQIPNSYINQNVKILIKWIMMTLILLIPFIIFITLFITNTLTRKLRRITKVVQSTNVIGNTITRKDFGKLFHSSPAFFDEMDKLADTFLTMIGKMEESVGENLKLSLQGEQLKYQLLQSQINPHFLYNILGSIQICQSMGRLEAANQMVTDLAKFYRLTLRKSEELITIRDELEITTLYLQMEQICRGNSFTWEVIKEEGIENFMICKFTLQPFLENCILHGLYAGERKMHICIHMLYGEDTVIMTVRDDGCGMSVEQLEDIRYSLEHGIIDTNKHFGISNVNARISSPLYGAGFITIESCKNEGTTIRIQVEQLLQDKEEVKNYENGNVSGR